MRWRRSRPRYTKVSGDHSEKWSLIKTQNQLSKYELQLQEAKDKYYREKIEYAANSLKENTYNRIMEEKSHIDRTARARNKIGILRRNFGPPPPKNFYTVEEMERLNQLKKALESLDYKNINKLPSNEMCTKYQRLIDAMKPIIAKKEEEKAKIRVKRSHEKAIIASALGKTREAANSIKRYLKQQIIEFPNCPYCNKDIGKKPH